MHFKRLLCVFMVALLLIADSGQFLYAHTCHKSGHTTFSLSDRKGCCYKAGESNCGFKKSSCCHITTGYAKQPVAGVFQAAHPFKFAAAAVTVRNIFMFSEPVPFIAYSTSVYAPLPGKSDICYTGAFRC